MDILRKIQNYVKILENYFYYNKRQNYERSCYSCASIIFVCFHEYLFAFCLYYAVKVDTNVMIRIRIFEIIGRIDECRDKKKSGCNKNISKDRLLM